MWSSFFLILDLVLNVQLVCKFGVIRFVKSEVTAS